MSSSVFRWPERNQVEAALRAWVETRVRHDASVQRVGYFGSYARNEWGVGSDLDVVLVVEDHGGLPSFERRGSAWDLSALPVPSDLFVYTASEWQALVARGDRFATVLKTELVWVYERQSS